MGIGNKRLQYKEWRAGVRQCTFNPEGPGVVRMHLVPPKFSLFKSSPYILILNGYYLLPLGYSWAVLLSEFMEETSRFEAAEIGESELDGIIFEIAQGGEPNAEIEKLSVRSYSGSMTAPHRMDLMVKSMTDGEGNWQCNQRCRFCYAAGQCKSESRELSAEEWKSIIDKLREARVPMLTFTGGEPTLREDIAELVDYARWFVTRLNTNGVKLDERLTRELRAAGLDSLQITLYSADEDVHNGLVGCEHFKDTVRGIENAVRAGLDVSINTPLCRSNGDYMRTLEFIHSLGVRFVTLSGLIMTGGAAQRGEEELSEDELFRIVGAAAEYCRENGMEMDFTSPGLISEERLESLGLNIPSCGAALSNMAVAPDGTVMPCQSWLGAEASLGNILTEKFKKIWNKPFAKSLRAMSAEEARSCPFRKMNIGEER